MSQSYVGHPVSQPPSSGADRRLATSSGTTNLAELLERVLDKGIVIAGDITVSLGQVELLSIKLRLIVASIDKAQEIGIDWWRSDPTLSSQAKQLEQQNQDLKDRLERVEERLRGLPAPAPTADATQHNGATPAQNGQAGQAQPAPPQPSS
jgi:hypothetical protein